MSADSLALGVVGWLATFAVHSTVLLGTAWLLASRLSRGAHRAEERWWKVALVAGVLTASGQTALGIRPFTGELFLPAVETTMAPAKGEQIETFESAPLLSAGLAPAMGTVPVMSSLAAKPRVPAPENGGLTESVRAWVQFAFFGWLALALAGLTNLFLGWTRLTKRLRHRTQLGSTDGGSRGMLHDMFLELAENAGLRGKVRLSASNQINSPITLGIGRREICVPHAAVDTLSREEQRAMLAHELSHARRNDPAWLLVLHVLERVFFFQPLLRAARVRQQHLAEYQCDDWAIEQTRDPVSLASCLTEVASWVVTPRTYQLAASMAASRFELDTRVRRILAPDAQNGHRLLQRVLVPLAFTLVVAVLFGAPTVSAYGEPREATTPPFETRGKFAAPSNDLATDVRLTVTTDPTSPDQFLALLDTELGALRLELTSLRAEALGVDAPVNVLEALHQIELRVESLALRRERLAELLPMLASEVRADSPAAQN